MENTTLPFRLDGSRYHAITLDRKRPRTRSASNRQNDRHFPRIPLIRQSQRTTNPLTARLQADIDLAVPRARQQTPNETLHRRRSIARSHRSTRLTLRHRPHVFPRANRRLRVAQRPGPMGTATQPHGQHQAPELVYAT